VTNWSFFFFPLCAKRAKKKVEFVVWSEIFVFFIWSKCSFLLVLRFRSISSSIFLSLSKVVDTLTSTPSTIASGNDTLPFIFQLVKITSHFFSGSIYHNSSTPPKFFILSLRSLHRFLKIWLFFILTWFKTALPFIMDAIFIWFFCFDVGAFFSCGCFWVLVSMLFSLTRHVSHQVRIFFLGDVKNCHCHLNFCVLLVSFTSFHFWLFWNVDVQLFQFRASRTFVQKISQCN